MQYSLEWLKARADRAETIKYFFFWGHTSKTGEAVGNFIFSQWYPSPFVVGDVTYPTAEHWMMAQKASLFGDTAILEKIVRSEKPGDVKSLGRKIKNFDEKVWNAHKFEIVVAGNTHKFGQHPAFKAYLLSTGIRVLVETSPVDNIWGIGLAADAPQAHNPHTWKGENLLGFALMEVRDKLLQNVNS